MKIIDMHCDTISRIYQETSGGASLRENIFQVDLLKMRSAGYLLQNFALFIDLAMTKDPYGTFLGQLAVFQAEMQKNSDLISPVRSYSDILANKAQGRMSALLTLEEGEVCGGSLKRLKKIYDMGIRMMTFTWNYPNSLGFPAEPAQPADLSGDGNTAQHMEQDVSFPDDGSTVQHMEQAASFPDDGSTVQHMEQAASFPGAGNTVQHMEQAAPFPDDGSTAQQPEQGLTRRGMEFLAEMERLGIIADVSHLSDAGIRDVCRLATKPFCASHSNARSLCGRGRNLPDSLIRAISEKGGVIGINYYGPFLNDTKDVQGIYLSRIRDIVRHISHISSIGGIYCIGLGSDFDGIDDHLELKNCSQMELLEHELKKCGFHPSEIEQIFYKNVLDFYKELL